MDARQLEAEVSRALVGFGMLPPRPGLAAEALQLGLSRLGGRLGQVDAV